MGPNVKDTAAHRSAQAIARSTGESLMRVVQVPCEGHAEIPRRKGRASVEDPLAIADRTAALVKRPQADHADLLYDARGLPR